MIVKMASPMDPVSVTLNTSPQVYENQSIQVPKGWSKEAVTRAMTLGSSRFSIYMLQPSSECCTFAGKVRPKARGPGSIHDHKEE